MSLQYITYSSRGNGITEYVNFAAFPSLAPNGTLAVDLSTDTLYIYNSTSVSWVAIASPGAVTGIVMGAYDGQPKAATGASIVGNALFMQSADATHPGEVSTGVQTFAGNKTFTGTISASNLSGTNTGDVTLGTANGLSLLGQVLSLQLADTSNTGALSNTDWNTFNSKFNLPALTSGSVLFSDGSTIAQDNANFFWDDSANRLGIGTNAPGASLQVVGDIAESISATDGAAVGISATTSTHTTADGSSPSVPFYGIASATVDAGATNFDSLAGCSLQVTRGDGTDDGTLFTLAGALTLLFHNAGPAGTTTRVFGNRIVNFLTQGAITDAYDLSLLTIPSGTGTIGNHYGLHVPAGYSASTTNAWGVWVGDTSTNNYFANNVVIGGVTGLPTGSFALDVTGSVKIADGTQGAGYVFTSDASGAGSWNAPGNYITALTGDVTASGPGSVDAVVALASEKRYVNFLTGDDTTGTGSDLRPWKTIAHAYASISPSINDPYVIYLSGGNNDSDASPISAKPNVSLVADYAVQINQAFSIVGGVLNESVSFTNIIFTGAFDWVRNDATIITMTLFNTQFFSGPTFKQTGSGGAILNAKNSVFVNSDFLLPNFGSFCIDCTFLGTTVFEDVSNVAYLEIMGGYIGGPMSIAGGPFVYFSGVQADVPFGYTLTTTSTGNGSPTIQTDAGSVPASISGPNTLVFIDNANHVAYAPAVPANWPSPPTQVAQALDELATLSGAAISVGSFDGQPASADGLTLASNILYAQSADVTHPGMVNNTTQSFSGDKTFTGAISASNLSGTNTGDVTLTAVGSTPNADGASLSGQALTLQPADGTHPGVLSEIAQTIGGVKTFSSAPVLSSLTASLPLQLDASKNIISQAINLQSSQITNVPPQQIRVVAKNGNDSTGNGSWEKPYLTVTAAVAGISDAASNKHYVILLQPGNYSETAPFAPFIHIKGSLGQFGSQACRITLPASSTFTIGAGISNIFLLLQDIQLSGTGVQTIQPDATASGTMQFRTQNVNNSTGSGLAFKSSSGSAINVGLVSGIQGTLSLVNVGGQAGTVLTSYQAQSLSSLSLDSAPANLYQSNVSGAITAVNTTAAIGPSVSLFECPSYGNISLTDTQGTAALVILEGSSPIDPASTTISVTGAGTTLNVDAISLPTSPSAYTLSGGATLNLYSEAHAMGYSPTTSSDWNSVPTNVRSALDTLATSGVVKSQTQNQVLASPNGSSGVPSFRALVAADLPAGTSEILISENITLSGTDITNQYVDLAHPIKGASASVNSAQLSVAGGPVQLKTVDYTVSLTGGSGGVTRITFAGDLATGGGAALIAGDILIVSYEY